ncbi:hypothetical protein [uncultured Flavobacterium sp.]|uniref:hypothetical protein n=1 Tax=uncultured Flavobacterium sp. TaxID=165435 RepID=UPI002596FE70|nr:hypothetical protein [uncultured Flavobacterium sp.]
MAEYIMKDASSCKISLKGLSIATGQVPERTIGDVIVRGVPSKEIKIDELILESNLDYQFDEGELKDTNNAVVEVFKQVTNLSVMILNNVVADKRAGREAAMTREDKHHENEMAKLRLIDELDDLKNKRIHERERYNASKI